MPHHDFGIEEINVVRRVFETWLPSAKALVSKEKTVVAFAAFLNFTEATVKAGETLIDNATPTSLVPFQDTEFNIIATGLTMARNAISHQNGGTGALERTLLAHEGRYPWMTFRNALAQFSETAILNPAVKLHFSEANEVTADEIRLNILQRRRLSAANKNSM